MANNVAITPGVGASVATEDQGSVHFQAIVQSGWRASPLSEVAVNIAASGDNTIVAAVAAQKVRLYRFFVVANAAVNLKWKDGAGADFHPVIYLLGQGSYWELPLDTIPYFTTSVGNALILNLSGAVQVSGRAYYYQGT